MTIFGIDLSSEELKSIALLLGFAVSTIALLLNVFVTLRQLSSRKVTSYHDLTKSHRELWKMTMEKPELYSRIVDRNADINKFPVTYNEERFVHLILLHATTAYYLSKDSHLIEIEKMKFDLDNFLSHPIPKLVWFKKRQYFNEDFVYFIEMPLKRKRRLNLIRFEAQKRLNGFWTILVLGPFPENVLKIASSLGDNVIYIADEYQDVTKELILNRQIDCIICFGYHKLLVPDVLNGVVALNIHGGYLPFNKGPNPSLWAWLENQRYKGASLHYIDSGVNTGDIIDQVEIEITDTVAFNEYLQMTKEYSELLLEKNWKLIRASASRRIKQNGVGSFHRYSDQTIFNDLLNDDNYNLPIKELRRKIIERIYQH